MDSKDTQKARGIMARIRNSKGFSLIEMAIVLVIIGIIIAAIIKGQDLIINSRAKQVAGAASTWRNLAMAHLDRNGKLPGADATTGFIVASAVAPIYSSSTKEIIRKMPTAPPNPVVVGGSKFYFYFGHTTGTEVGKNVMVICGDTACGTAFTKDQLEIIKSVDVSIDGDADADRGQFRGKSSITTISTTDPAGFATTPVPTDSTTAGAATAQALPWNIATGYMSAIWAFDRPF